jgi:hypothetical protein
MYVIKRKKEVFIMADKKMTKRDYFNALLNISEVKENKSMVEFINHELELLEKKNASKSTKPTKKQGANDKLKDLILDSMELDTPYTVTELCNNIDIDQNLLNELGVQTLTNSKVTSMLTQLVNIARVSRTESKGRAYYSKLF